MLMVVAYHWQLHGNNNLIYASELNMNQIFSFAIGLWGTCAVNAFFVISSYFLLKDNAVDLGKLISTIIKVSVYGTMICVIAYAFGLVAPDRMTLIKAVLGVFAYQYWFITVYVVLYTLHPALNCIIKNVRLKYLYLMCTVVFIATYLVGFIFLGEFLGRLACAFAIYLFVGTLEKAHFTDVFKRKFVRGYCILLYRNCSV